VVQKLLQKLLYSYQCLTWLFLMRITTHLVTWLIATGSRRLWQVLRYSFRNMKKVNWQQFRSNEFRSNVYSSKLFTAPKDTADFFTYQFDTVVTKILDQHCPVQNHSKLTLVCCVDRRMYPAAVNAKLQWRKLEWDWNKLANFIHSRWLQVSKQLTDLSDSRGLYHTVC